MDAQVHRDSLHRLTRTPITFFDTTPIGRVLNRFSKVRAAISALPCARFTRPLIGFPINFAD